MKRFFSARNIAMAIGTSALLAVAYGGIAHAITDTAFRYSKPVTGYFSFGPQALTPGNNSVADSYVIHGPDYATWQDGCFYSGINVPQDAKLTGFAAWIATNSADGADIILWRTNLATGSSVDISSFSTGSTGASRVALSVPINDDALAIVNNQHFHYAVSICFNVGANYFYSGRVTYSYSNAGD